MELLKATFLSRNENSVFLLVLRESVGSVKSYLPSSPRLIPSIIMTYHGYTKMVWHWQGYPQCYNGYPFPPFRRGSLTRGPYIWNILREDVSLMPGFIWTWIWNLNLDQRFSRQSDLLLSSSPIQEILKF